MIRVAHAESQIRLQDVLNSLLIQRGNIQSVVATVSGGYTVLYDDGAPQGAIQTDPRFGVSGVSITALDNTGVTVALGGTWETETDEDLGEPGVGAYDATLSATYVRPGSLALTYGSLSFKDNGAGALIRSDTGAKVGTIDYETGDLTITIPSLSIDGGTLTGTYDASATPQFSDPPDRVELGTLILTLTAGDASLLTWKLLDDEAGEYPVAEGQSAVSVGEPVYIDLNRISVNMDRATRTKRWLFVSADAGVNSDVSIRLSWRA